MEKSQAAPPVTRTDRWRYRSAVHAARVLNSIGRVDTIPAPRRSAENQLPQHAQSARPTTS